MQQIWESKPMAIHPDHRHLYEDNPWISDEDKKNMWDDKYHRDLENYLKNGGAEEASEVVVENPERYESEVGKLEATVEMFNKLSRAGLGPIIDKNSEIIKADNIFGTISSKIKMRDLYAEQVGRYNVPATREIFERGKNLYSQGLVGADVVKVFLNPDLMGYENRPTDIYRNLVYVNKEDRKYKEETMPLLDQAFIDFVTPYPDGSVVSQSYGSKFAYRKGGWSDFHHFNFKNHGDINSRVYLSFKNDDAAKAKGLECLKAALDKTGLTDQQYFKVYSSNYFRKDDIVLYRDESKVSDEDFRRLLQSFKDEADNSPIDIFPEDEDLMPTVNSIHRGIGIASEPSLLNKYIVEQNAVREIKYGTRAKTSGRHSMNTFYDRLLQLSYVVASDRASRGKAKYGRGIIDNRSSNGVYKIGKNVEFGKEVCGVMGEFLRMSGINPDTGMDEKFGNDLPVWAKLD